MQLNSTPVFYLPPRRNAKFELPWNYPEENLFGGSIMSDSTKTNCGCSDEFTMLPVHGFGLAVKTSSLPGGSGVEPGPDNTHLVSRDGALAWDPIAPGGDGVNYSTEEQWTGKLWIDGRKVYQKTFTTGILGKKDQRISIQHGIANFDMAVWGCGTTKNPNDQYGYILPSHEIFWLYSPNEIIFIVKSDWNNYTETFVTVFYVCTDR